MPGVTWPLFMKRGGGVTALRNEAENPNMAVGTRRVDRDGTTHDKYFGFGTGGGMNMKNKKK